MKVCAAPASNSNTILIFLPIFWPPYAAEADGLIGIRKLVSWQVIVDNGPSQNVLGSRPNGFLILTRGAQHGGDDRRKPPRRNR